MTVHFDKVTLVSSQQFTNKQTKEDDDDGEDIIEEENKQTNKQTVHFVKVYSLKQLTLHFVNSQTNKQKKTTSRLTVKFEKQLTVHFAKVMLVFR